MALIFTSTRLEAIPSGGSVSVVSIIHDMIQRCQNLVGGILAFIVLVVLHLIHGSTLLLALFLHLTNHIQLSSNRPSSKQHESNNNHILELLLQKDALKWKSKNKIPKCLGIIFVPTARGYFSINKLKYTSWSKSIILQGMIEDLIKIVEWSLELGIEDLLLYDENGKQFISFGTVKSICE